MSCALVATWGPGCWYAAPPPVSLDLKSYEEFCEELLSYTIRGGCETAADGKLLRGAMAEVPLPRDVTAERGRQRLCVCLCEFMGMCKCMCVCTHTCIRACVRSDVHTGLPAAWTCWLVRSTCSVR